jgi:predicted RNase H-like nuclease (RuvC/YqgF family)
VVILVVVPSAAQRTPVAEPPVEKKVAHIPSVTGKMSHEANLLQRHIEEAESRVQRGQRNVDRQRKVVSDLERDNDDATIAKRLLTMLEKALAMPVADRDRLTKRRAHITRYLRLEPDHASACPTGHGHKEKPRH